jgi:predicted hotdog family 3-hydroxylacyl-ACP dehydratase
MVSGETMNGLTRSAAAALVERETYRTGSRMTAYEIVAQTVGVSSSWLRKYLANGHEAKEPGLISGFNILRQYELLCERVEQDNANRAARIAALKDQINAATESSVGQALAVAGGKKTEER